MIKVGDISQRVIDLLQLDVEVGTPIYISPSNIEHMINTHPHDIIYLSYEKI